MPNTLVPTDQLWAYDYMWPRRCPTCQRQTTQYYRRAKTTDPLQCLTCTEVGHADADDRASSA